MFLGVSNTKRERQRANRKKKLLGKVYDLPDFTPVNAFRVMAARQNTDFKEKEIEDYIKYR